MAKANDTQDVPAPQEQEQQYMVAHTVVGPYFAGQTVTHKQFGVDKDDNPTVDLQRLIDLGAIVPIGSPAAAEVQKTLGPDAVTPLGDKVFGSADGQETASTPIATTATPPVATPAPDAAKAPF